MTRKPVSWIAIAGFLAVATFALWGRGPLSFEERVKAQEAIERVYYNHRTWPKENPQPKPPFEQMVPKAVIEAKVTDYLKKCAALDKYWQRPIQPEQLQAEMDRMAKETKDPAMLKDLFAALGNDPTLVAECLSRPTLAGRLVGNWYANDRRIHDETRQEAEAALRSVTSKNLGSCHLGEYRRIRFKLSASGNGARTERAPEEIPPIELAPAAFSAEQKECPPEDMISQVIEREDAFVLLHTLRATRDELLVESLTFRKRPLASWLPRQAPSLMLPETSDSGPFTLPPVHEALCGGTWDDGILGGFPDIRVGHVAVWTGSEMIIWGGYDINSGGRYNPSTDTWQSTSTGANCPAGRQGSTAVWTGSEMIIWGGYWYDYALSADHFENSGGRYNPTTDSWAPTSTGVNVPDGRHYHTAVWTGSKMIIWGGSYWEGNSSYLLNTGGRYDPASDSWAQTSTGLNVPAARDFHTAVWTGTAMVVWGGEDGAPAKTGGRYNPTTNSWTPTAVGGSTPSARLGHTAVFAGSEMIAWGGSGFASGTETNTGGRYDPSSDSWSPISTGTNVPPARSSHSAVWTGVEMIVWGGATDSSHKFRDGGRYDPLTDSWAAVSVGAGCLTGRFGHTAVWTGSEMIVWGGEDREDSPHPTNTGARYSPSSDSWVPTFPGATLPSPRDHHTAVWTGSEMIVWGGELIGTKLNTGGRYSPSTDSWTPTPTDTNTPIARHTHTAVWTGEKMIVWGGQVEAAPYKTNTGGSYDVALDSWTPTSTGGSVPSSRSAHTAVWTGTEMIVWGGYTNTGGRYNPVTDLWTPTSTGANAPSGVAGHSAVWTGSEMTVWGGRIGSGDFVNSGGSYNPTSDSWRPTSVGANVPTARSGHTAVWTGSDMAIWGGWWSDGTTHLEGTGARYNPVLDAWTAMSSGASAPSARSGHTSVWDGSEMLTWGGGDAAGYLDSGARYSTAEDSWGPISSSTGNPSARARHTAVWTGSTMIVWGGMGGSMNWSLNSGGLYDPYHLPPPEPSSPTFANVGCHSQTVSWAQVDHAASYDVWRATGSSCAGASKITSSPITDTSYTDADLNFGTQYSYFVTANNICGASPDGACASSTTAPGPATPASPNFSAVTTTTLTVNWPGAAYANSYDVWRASGTSCASATKITSTPICGFSFTDTGRTPGSKYSYYITANGECGTSGSGTCATVTMQSGTTPGEVSPGSTLSTSTIWGSDKTTLSWQSTLFATAYRLYRGTPADLPNLLTSATDSCKRYDSAAVSCNLNGTGDTPAAGSFLWFLVTGRSATAEGTPGSATAGTRIVNSSGICP
jgi:hypothetical protein